MKTLKSLNLRGVLQPGQILAQRCPIYALSKPPWLKRRLPGRRAERAKSRSEDRNFHHRQKGFAQGWETTYAVMQLSRMLLSFSYNNM